MGKRIGPYEILDEDETRALVLGNIDAEVARVRAEVRSALGLAPETPETAPEPPRDSFEKIKADFPWLYPNQEPKP